MGPIIRKIHFWLENLEDPTFNQIWLRKLTATKIINLTKIYLVSKTIRATSTEHLGSMNLIIKYLWYLMLPNILKHLGHQNHNYSELYLHTWKYIYTYFLSFFNTNCYKKYITHSAEQVTGSVMKKVREDFEQFRTRLKFDQPISSDDSSEKIDFANKDAKCVELIFFFLYLIIVC